MNRNMLNLNTFDPAPMALGERTTRLPPAPVNPRAAFEAFERGVISRSRRFTGPLDQFTRDLARDMAIPYEAIAQPTPEPDDGEGDTPDIRARINAAYNKMPNVKLRSCIRTCFLDLHEAANLDAKPGSPTMRYVQALERAVRETRHPVTLAMCHTLFNHQKHAGRDVARVMRSFGVNDTRELGAYDQRAAFFACLVII